MTKIKSSKNKVSITQVFRSIIWPRKNKIFLGLLLIIVSRSAGLYLPSVPQNLMDNIVPSGDVRELYKMLFFLVLALFIQSSFGFLLTRILSVEAQYLISELRAQVQRKILSLPISFFDNHKTGELVSRIMTDVEGVRNIVGTGLVQLIGGTLTSIASLVLLIRINWRMTVFVLIPVIIFAIVALKAFGYIRPIFKNRGKINADVTGRLTETLNGVRVIKGFNAENQENRVFQGGVDRLFRNIKKSLTANALIINSSSFILGIASAGILGLGGYFMMQVGANAMTGGELFSFTLYLGFMIAPIVQMSNIGTQMTEAFAGLDRTEEIMNLSPEDDKSERTIGLKNIDGTINFKDVSYSYKKGKKVIHNLSFTAPKGSVTALVGTSGSGKSTIAGLAASFLTPNTGEITIDGINLSKVKLSSYRQYLGVVLQDDFLFEGTIRENILFSRPNASQKDLENAINTAYVNEFTDRFDDGIETMIGERGVKLSGGQRQRVAIARAILADPKIIILDEATSNLDTESESLIQKSLAKLMEGRTTFVIAHRLSTIKKASQILVVEKGTIEEQGTHDDLIFKKGRYYELFTYQSRI
jgi:subfamily B ATP-binding cassette protein MsbA